MYNIYSTRQVNCVARLAQFQVMVSTKTCLFVVVVCRNAEASFKRVTRYESSGTRVPPLTRQSRGSFQGSESPVFPSVSVSWTQLAVTPFCNSTVTVCNNEVCKCLDRTQGGSSRQLANRKLGNGRFPVNSTTLLSDSVEQTRPLASSEKSCEKV